MPIVLVVLLLLSAMRRERVDDPLGGELVCRETDIAKPSTPSASAKVRFCTVSSEKIWLATIIHALTTAAEAAAITDGR